MLAKRNPFVSVIPSPITYPITIEIYPIYEMTTGVVWEDDVFDDDLIGYFNVKRAIGDDIRVYAQY